MKTDVCLWFGEMGVAVYPNDDSVHILELGGSDTTITEAEMERCLRGWFVSAVEPKAE